MSSLRIALAAGALVAMTGAVAAQATSVAEAIKSRQANMKQLGGTMKALSEMVKSGKIDPAAAGEQARKIDGHAATLPTWFPAGTGPESGVETKAKPEIWSNGEAFKKAASDLKAETAKLIPAAATGDAQALGTQLGATGKACKTCHTQFESK